MPSWSPADEPKPAPQPLLLVQAFVNTRDPDAHTDVLLDRDAARAWFESAGLGQAVDLEAARAVREGIRALLVANNGGPEPTEEDLRPLGALAASNAAALTLDRAGRFALEGTGLLGLLLAIRDAQEDGSWSRLKACRNPDCHWAFYDRTRNRRGTWCEMAACGNRLKNRSFRARARGG